MLEQGVGSVWIEGEISNFTQPASGHWYFSLKDERAQLRAAMFKNRNQRVVFRPENGQQVLLRAQVTLYEARGEFQVIVEHMEEAGLGRLMREYEALKKRLAGEGLFADEHKKPIPAQAKHIGIITSSTGAAIRDALSVIQRRSPSTEVTIYPTAVQGEAATPEIVRGIQRANTHGLCDVLLVIRGGGSLEDLWCFNEEVVARAIFESQIPIVSGIGHEIDFTIADFVADARAPTPSVAAETVTMDQYEIMSQLDLLQARLTQQYAQSISRHAQVLQHLIDRLMSFHPQRQMAQLTQRLQFAIAHLSQTELNQLSQLQAKVRLIYEQLNRLNPTHQLPIFEQRLQRLHHQLMQSIQQQLSNQQHLLSMQAKALDHLSPLKTLARGFAVIQKDGELVSSISQIQTDDQLTLKLKDGDKNARVL